MNKLLNPKSQAQRHQHGFSMIEVLVTLMVIAFSLLGTAGLQAYAMKVSKGGQLRTQAVFMVADLVERMEANRVGAVNGSYALALTTSPPAASTACTSGACTPDNLATYDLSQWQNMIATGLPQSSWQVVQTTAGNPSVYTITINWVDRRTDTAYSTTGTGEASWYTATRLVLN